MPMAPRTRLLLPAALLLLSSAAFAEPARLEQARQALRERSFAKAQELASEELRANPQADEALYLRALAQFHQQRLSEAREDVARLLLAKPDSTWRHKARFLDAECLSRARDFKAAAAVLSDEAQRLLSAPRKRELCGVIVRFADALARERDPKDPKDLDGPPADYRKACALYDKALGLEIDEQTREEVLFKRARAREHVQAYQATREYVAYLERFDPTWGDAPGRERRPTGAHRWEARERLLHAMLQTNRGQAWRLADDLLRLLETPAGKSAPAELGATVAWLRLRAIGMPTPPRHALPAGLQASEAFLAAHPR
ncbi:MAG TPA: hypothetical protein DEA08_27365, partial [Planctomycetes bacterium]|nr:hypothetical protein [Planctomycetota bacterium]